MKKPTLLHKGRSALLIACLGFGVSGPGNAQIQELEAFRVTAQKYEQNVQDVPISITAYDEDFQDVFQISDLESMSAYVPNLEIQEQSPNNPGFVIRGITSDSGASNLEPRVSIFQDGVSISKSRGSYVELFDVERIEVLKGPQGTLFGRGAQIGAVHIIQNKAQNLSSSGLKLAYGDYSEIQAQGYVNMPVSDDLYIRLAGSWWERDGYIDNLAGGDLNGKDTMAARFSMAWEPSETSRLDVIINWQEDNYPGTSFKSQAFGPPGGTTSPFSAAYLNRGDELRIDRSVWGVTGIYSVEINDAWSLTSTTAYREFDSYEEFDADGTIAYYLEFAEDATGDQFSQELRFNFDDGGQFVGFTGLSYFWEEGSQRVPLRYDERSVFSVFGAMQPLIGPDGQPVIVTQVSPFNGRPLLQNYTETFTNFGETAALEAFADGTYRVNDRFEVTAGLRVTYEDIESGFLVENNPTPFVLAPVTGNPSFLLEPSNGLIEGSDTFTSMVGRLVGNYKFSDQGSLYASISRGRRPNVINADNQTTETLQDEIVWSYEAGVKSVFRDGTLYFDASVFYYEYENFQTSVTELQGGGTLVTETRDSGNATAYGFESSVNLRASENVFLFANLGYVDATFDDLDSDGNTQDLAGNRFRLTPEWSFSIGADFQYDFNRDTVFFLAPAYTWKDQVFFEEENQPGIEQESYGLVNAKLGMRWNEGKYELSLYGTNLADEEFLIDAGNTGQAFGLPTFIAGPPRFYGIQFIGRF